MEVAMNFLDAVAGEGFAAIFGKEHLRAENPNAEVVVGIDANLTVVGGAGIGVAHFFPAFALVFAAEHAALFVLDERVNDVGALTEDIETDTPDVSAVLVGQAFGQFVPGGSAV